MPNKLKITSFPRGLCIYFRTIDPRTGGLHSILFHDGRTAETDIPADPFLRIFDTVGTQIALVPVDAIAVIIHIAPEAHSDANH